jgi:hypothetical protein
VSAAIVYQLLSRGDESFNHISDYSPFFEVDRTWESDKVASHYSTNHDALGWRVFNTHLRWEVMPKGAKARYIYMYRSPMDVCASFYHHLSNQSEADGGYVGSFEQFVIDWVENRVPFGTWSGHLRSWNVAREDKSYSESLLFVRYEDMVGDLSSCITRVASFLGLDADPAVVSLIMPRLTFGGMRARAQQYQPVSVKWKNNFQFIRKGVVGDSASLFNTVKRADGVNVADAGDTEAADLRGLVSEMITREFPVRSDAPLWIQECM